MAIVNVSGILDFETKSETQEKINEVKAELTKEIKKTEDKTVQTQKELLEHSQGQDSHSALFEKARTEMKNGDAGLQKELLEHSQGQDSHSTLFQKARTEMTNSVTQTKQESVQKIQEHNQSSAAHQQRFSEMQTKLDQKADKRQPQRIQIQLFEGFEKEIPMYCFKTADGVVTIVAGLDKSSPLVNNELLFVLPEGFRPEQETNAVIQLPATYYYPFSPGLVWIKENGHVQVGHTQLTSQNRVFINLTFLAK